MSPDSEPPSAFCWTWTTGFASTPSARICARYVSLLRYICRQQGEHQYDRIVIVAHSQGTVITADLLRFLHTEYLHGADYDPALGRMFSGELPVYLFTMGCPLRQLHGLRFPYLYGWARAHADDPRDIRPAPGPPGTRLWTNAYRSGDYIGRHLWREDHDHAALMDPCARVQNLTDYGIGPGAHTHYWDHTAPASVTC